MVVRLGGGAQLLNLTRARTVLKQIVERDLVDERERAEKWVLCHIQALLRDRARRLLITPFTNPHLHRHHLRYVVLHGVLDGGDHIAERVRQHEELIALRERVLHLAEDEVQVRHAQQFENAHHYESILIVASTGLSGFIAVVLHLLLEEENYRLRHTGQVAGCDVSPQHSHVEQLLREMEQELHDHHSDAAAHELVLALVSRDHESRGQQCGLVVLAEIGDDDGEHEA